MITLVTSITLVSFAAALLLVPHISRPQMFFGVRVAEDFAASAEARRIVSRYRTIIVACCLLLIIATLVAPNQQRSILAGLAPVLLFIGSSFAVIRSHRNARTFHSPSPTLRTASLQDDAFPRWMGLAVVPLLVLGVAALYLYGRYPELPQRFPVHWGADGIADSWRSKSYRTVFAPLLFGFGLELWILVVGVVTFYGSRKAPMRKSMLAFMLMAMAVCSLLFAGVSILPFARLSASGMGAVLIAIVVANVALALAAVVWAVSRLSDASDPDITPDECWRGGGNFYYNPEDAALFVEKRVGFGYTVNFGNRWSWAFLAGMVVSLVGLVSILA